MIIRELTETRKKELELMFQKEIKDYQNKIICKQKFIYLIKRCNIMEFCYLYQTYIGEIESVRKLPDITLSENNYIETVDKTNYEYNSRTNKKSYLHKNTKKLVRIEKLAQKKTHYKQYK